VGADEYSKEPWLVSEVAPLIGRIVWHRAAPGERVAAARDLAAWLSTRGDRLCMVEWLEHPNLRIDGFVWSVDPCDGDGHGHSGRLDTWWWAVHYPTPAYTESAHAEQTVRTWLDRNSYAVEQLPWTREVAARIGLLELYNERAAEREDLSRLVSRRNARREEQIRRAYAGLALTSPIGLMIDGAGI
jgi:hypothetical protein